MFSRCPAPPRSFRIVALHCQGCLAECAKRSAAPACRDGVPDSQCRVPCPAQPSPSSCPEPVSRICQPWDVFVPLLNPPPALAHSAGPPQKNGRNVFFSILFSALFLDHVWTALWSILAPKREAKMVQKATQKSFKKQA